MLHLWDSNSLQFYASVVHVKTEESVKAAIAGEEAAQIVLIHAASVQVMQVCSNNV